MKNCNNNNNNSSGNKNVNSSSPPFPRIDRERTKKRKIQFVGFLLIQSSWVYDDPVTRYSTNSLFFLSPVRQSDQIGRFIALWATFRSLWQQLFCPNRPHFYAIFEKTSKTFILLLKLFRTTFYKHWAIFTGHTGPSRHHHHCLGGRWMWGALEVMKGEATILLNYCLISLDNIDKIVHSFDVGFNGLRLKSIWFSYLMTQLLYYLIALLGS